MTCIYSQTLPLYFVGLSTNIHQRTFKTCSRVLHDEEQKSKSSRRRSIDRRPLTPPCVPFGTRRFNQLNKWNTVRCSSLTWRLAQMRLISCCLWPGLHPRLYKLSHSLLHRLFAMPPIWGRQALSDSLLCSSASSSASRYTSSVDI